MENVATLSENMQFGRKFAETSAPEWEEMVDMPKTTEDDQNSRQAFAIPNTDMFNVWSEFVYKMNQLRPLAADIGLLSGLVSLSNYETYFLYDDEIGMFCSEEVKSDLGKKNVDAKRIICNLRDSHPTCDGGILFTDEYLVNYPVEGKQFWCIPYRDIKSVNYDEFTLSLETRKGTYDDFNLDGWNPENIGLFLQTVIGVKPSDKVEQAVLRGIVLDALGGKSIIKYLQ